MPVVLSVALSMQTTGVMNPTNALTLQADASGKPAATKRTLLTNSKGKVVAATIDTMDFDDDNVVAAFAPCAILGNGTDSNESDNVSAPLQGKHFVWKCTIDGSALEFPLKI